MDRNETLLGKVVSSPESYSPEILFPVSRKESRKSVGIEAEPPFHGVDTWRGYELSWLDTNGKPQVAMAEFVFDAASKNVVESKSFKLYLSSLNHHAITDWQAAERLIKTDLEEVSGSTVNVKLSGLEEGVCTVTALPGESIDKEEITAPGDQPDPAVLKTCEENTEETLHTNLFRSLCPITGQPDWASIVIRYTGAKINRSSLLQYLCAWRNHSGFHEQCIEKIFCDLLEQCDCEKLTVEGFFTRRGGLEINPFRTNCNTQPLGIRTIRQ